MEAGDNDDIISCLKICDDINDDNIDNFFPKLDYCLELAETLGREKLIFQKAILGVVRKCRKSFLTETKLPYKDVSDISNFFSEYIKEMTQLAGVDDVVQNCVEKKASCGCSTTKLHKFSTIFLILAMLTLLLGICTCWVSALMKRQNDNGKLALPKEMVQNLALTCEEMGIDPREMKILKEKTCFDKEYENIVNKYLKKRSDSLSAANFRK